MSIFDKLGNYEELYECFNIYRIIFPSKTSDVVQARSSIIGAISSYIPSTILSRFNVFGGTGSKDSAVPAETAASANPPAKDDSTKDEGTSDSGDSSEDDSAQDASVPKSKILVQQGNLTDFTVSYFDAKVSIYDLQSELIVHCV